METAHSTTRGQLLTVRGLADVLGVAEGRISEALASGRVRHDVTAWAGWRVLPLFYPESAADIGRRLTGATPRQHA